MKTTISLIFLSTLLFSGACLAKEKMVKDPLGTRCKTSDLTEIVSVSEPKAKTELPKEYQNLVWVKKSKKYVGVVVRKEKDGTTEQNLQLEKAHPGDSYFVSQPFYVEANEAKKLNLKISDKKYCLASVAPDGEDY